MCGLAFAYNFKGRDVNERIEHIYQNQIARGTEGFGLAVLSQNAGKSHMKVYRQTQELNFLVDIKIRLGHMILAHHRTPTSSDNKIEQTHPILVSNGSLKYDYLVVHNGIIHNEDTLKEEHEKLGFVYTTLTTERKYPNSPSMLDLETKFNDSESLAIELARYMDSQITTPKAAGSIAFILLQLQKATTEENEAGLLGIPLQLAFGHNSGNPLRMGRNNDQIILASELIGTEVPEDKIHFLNLLEPKSKMTILDVKLPTYQSLLPTTTPAKTNYNYGYGRPDQYADEDEYTYPGNAGALMLYNKDGSPIIRKPVADDGSEAALSPLDKQIKTANEEIWAQLYEIIYDFIAECNDPEFGDEPEKFIERMSQEMKTAIDIFIPLMIEKSRELELQEDLDAAIDQTTLEKAENSLVDEEIQKRRAARKEKKLEATTINPGCGTSIEALKEIAGKTNAIP